MKIGNKEDDLSDIYDPNYVNTTTDLDALTREVSKRRGVLGSASTALRELAKVLMVSI